jgi:hypothetical protein
VMKVKIDLTRRGLGIPWFSDLESCRRLGISWFSDLESRLFTAPLISERGYCKHLLD